MQTRQLFDPDIKKAPVRICTRCIYDERVAAITYDDQGVCNYCHQVDKLKRDFDTGTDRGTERLHGIIAQIKKDGRGKKYDCIVGVSGGTDSSYMVYLAKAWGLRPLAVHYDNTWNSAIATQNISKVLKDTGVDLYTHVIDNKESDDIFRAFFFAGVSEIEGSTDLALAEVMYRAASKYKVRYVLEGHSYITEGITPVGRNYFDGKYIQSIHKRFGRLPMKTYPLMTFARFIWWTVFLRIKKIRPYWYMDYSKEQAMDFLKKACDWQYYGGHHLENRMTAFFHGIYAPEKFNTDFRNNTLAALARNGNITREAAWAEYNKPPHIEDDLLAYFQKRLGLTPAEYEAIMREPPHAWYEFPTYKKRFEMLRPLFAILAKANLVPTSFYLKYCFPVKRENGATNA